MGKKVPSLVKVSVLLAFGLGVTNVLAVDACKENMGHSGNGTQVNGNQTGSINGTPWGFEQWSAGGSNSMTYYSNGTFKANWSNNQDYLARVGFRYGDSGPGVDHNTKHYTVDYNYTKTGSAQYGYIGVYGWTVNPQVEYYVVDDWYSKPSENYIGPKQGEITVDGATYTIHTYIRDNEPSKTGNSTFLQIFSVRQTPRQCGHIDISAHFKKWDELFKGQNANLPTSKGGQKSIQLKFGKVTEVMLMTEAGGGATGSVDYTYFNMSDNGDASPVGNGSDAGNTNTGSEGENQGGNQGGNFGGEGGQGFDWSQFGGGQGGEGGQEIDWSQFGGGQGGEGGQGFDWSQFGGGQGGEGGQEIDWSQFGGGQGGEGGQGFDWSQFGGGQGGEGGQGFDWGNMDGGNQSSDSSNVDKIDTNKIVRPVNPNDGFAALPSDVKIFSSSRSYNVFNTQGRYLGNVELLTGSSLSEAIFSKFGKAGIYMVKNGSKTMTIRVTR